MQIISIRVISLQKLTVIFMNWIFSTLAYLIFPPLCPVCKEIVDERGNFCPDCAKKILFVGCEKNFPEVLDGVFCLTKYHGGTQNLLLKLKFEKKLSALPPLKKILSDVAEREDLKKFIAQADFAIFVPLHEKRLKERGYNQTDLIFRDFLTEKNLPIENVLLRKKSTPKLYKFDSPERKKILEDAFEVVEGTNLSGKKILLLDDIFTTGATASECARVLKTHGAEKVFVLTFATAGYRLS